jgi:hypothetical protein
VKVQILKHVDTTKLFLFFCFKCMINFQWLAQQIWFLCFLFQNNLLHTASRAMSSTSWLQLLSQFWTGSWVGSLTSHNDIAELLLQLYICTHSHQMITFLFAMCLAFRTCHSTFSWRQFYFISSPSSLPEVRLTTLYFITFMFNWTTVCELS